MDINHACYRILEEVSRTIDLSDMSRTQEVLDAIRGAKRVFVHGAGRSGLMMRSFGMRLMQVGIDTYVVGETTTPEIRKGDVLIIGSGSGRTGGPVNYAQIARHSGVKIISMTVAKQSPLNELSDIIIRLPAPTPKLHEDQELPPSVQPLGSLFEQSMLVYLDALIILLMDLLGIREEALYTRLPSME